MYFPRTIWTFLILMDDLFCHLHIFISSHCFFTLPILFEFVLPNPTVQFRTPHALCWPGRPEGYLCRSAAHCAGATVGILRDLWPHSIPAELRHVRVPYTGLPAVQHTGAVCRLPADRHQAHCCSQVRSHNLNW